MTKLLFGVNLSTSGAAGADPVSDALLAEGLGFDFVSSSDHPCGTNPTNEVWTMLAWVAARTSDIRIATRVLGVPFRNAVVTAKMAETLDRLSAGRLILGLGAGASDDEMTSIGLPKLSNRAKIDGLEEAITVLRGVWSPGACSYAGTHHAVSNAEVEPKPTRRIPVWLGTFGPRALVATGRVADGWIPSLGYAPEAKLPEMRERVVSSAINAGRDPNELDYVLNVEIRFEEREQTDGSVLVGPASHTVTRLRELQAIGFNGFNFVVVGPAPDEQIRRLAGDVLPELRSH